MRKLVAAGFAFAGLLTASGGGAQTYTRPERIRWVLEVGTFTDDVSLPPMKVVPLPASGRASLPGVIAGVSCATSAPQVIGSGESLSETVLVVCTFVGAVSHASIAATCSRQRLEIEPRNTARVTVWGAPTGGTIINLRCAGVPAGLVIP